MEKYFSIPCSILDVGSQNVNKKGCYKQIFSPSYTYLGVDLVAGDNVDIVLNNPYSFPFEENKFDVVISGQCFEHVKNPFKLIMECSRVLKPKGYFLGVAPYVYPIHRVPIDCWRFLPDGWNSLFEESGLTLIESYVHRIDETKNIDCWGIATK